MPRPPTVLGLRIGGSDPAVSLLVGGLVVESACASHVTPRVDGSRSPGFPTGAIEHCLSAAGLRVEDVDHVAYVEAPPEADRSAPGESLPESFARLLAPSPGAPPATFHRVETRRALLSNGFYSCPWEAAAVATVGGFGDPSGVVWGTGFDTALALGGAVAAEHSPARLTSAFSRHLGIDDEPRALNDLARRGASGGRSQGAALVRLGRRGRFEWIEPPGEGASRGSWPDWLTRSFGPARCAGEPLETRHLQATAVLQGALESVVLHVLQHLAAETGLDRLCLTGGAASSPELVDRIRADTPFREVFTPPALGDEYRTAGGAAGGTRTDIDAAAGAALDIWHRGLAFPRLGPIVRDARLAGAGGPGPLPHIRATG